MFKQLDSRCCCAGGGPCPVGGAGGHPILLTLVVPQFNPCGVKRLTKEASAAVSQPSEAHSRPHLEADTCQTRPIPNRRQNVRRLLQEDRGEKTRVSLEAALAYQCWRSSSLRRARTTGCVTEIRVFPSKAETSRA